MNRMAIPGSLALLVCCAPKFPVQPYGSDTYVVYVSSVSAAKAHRAAVEIANKYCDQRDLVMVPDLESSEASFDPWIGPRKDIQFIFRCYNASDPRLHPPEMRPTQRVIIEDD